MNLISIHKADCDGKSVSYGSFAVDVEFDAELGWFDDVSKCFIVLMKYYENKDVKRFQNLVAHDIEVGVLWRAELPQGSGPDSYVQCKIEESVLKANSFSGYICEIDLHSGKILDKRFTR